MPSSFGWISAQPGLLHWEAQQPAEDRTRAVWIRECTCDELTSSPDSSALPAQPDGGCPKRALPAGLARPGEEQRRPSQRGPDVAPLTILRGRRYQPAPQPQPCAVAALPPASKEWPQAQVATAFGLRTVKPPPIRLLM